MENTLDKKTLAIVKAIAYAENGGKPKEIKAGKTGEMKSIFQFTPDTWKHYAKQISGDENLQMTPENESLVTYHKVGEWIKKGYNTEQIASMWNAGEHRPDAYKQNWKGINKKYGVAYDTPAYAKKVSDYAKQFESGKDETTPANKGLIGGLIAQKAQQSTPQAIPQKIGSQMKEAKIF